jgi:hypothetical protein
MTLPVLLWQLLKVVDRKSMHYVDIHPQTELHNLPNELLLRILKDSSKSDCTPFLFTLLASIFLPFPCIYLTTESSMRDFLPYQRSVASNSPDNPCIILLAFSESIFEAGFGIGGKDKGICNPEVLINSCLVSDVLLLTLMTLISGVCDGSYLHFPRYMNGTTQSGVYSGH